jgi:hypothetical protein
MIKAPGRLQEHTLLRSHWLLRETYTANYEKREQRINDAIELKVPDRVPIFDLLQLYPIRHYANKAKDAYYKWNWALVFQGKRKSMGSLRKMKLLNESNCRECDEATYLAFAAKVFNGQ